MVPILRQSDRAVKQMLQQYDGQQINLIDETSRTSHKPSLKASALHLCCICLTSAVVLSIEVSG